VTAYFDTSALVPLVIAEPSSAICERAWNAARNIAASSLTYVEVHTALAQAERQGRITDAQLAQASAAFEDVWEQVTVVAPADAIIRCAARLGAEFALRGYDAVHCATAMSMSAEQFFAVTGDRALLDAWRTLGLATVDTNQDIGNLPAPSPPTV